jgi:hypothetical protein
MLNLIIIKKWLSNYLVKHGFEYFKIFKTKKKKHEESYEIAT